jgi:hypothetical protein
MKILKQHTLYNMLAIAIVLSFTNCKDKKVSVSSIFNCIEETKLSNLKETKEPNGNFEIKIPENWKKEFFISERESRLYFADTTQELNHSYITDIGLYQNKKVIDSVFFKNKLERIKNDTLLELINSGNMTFQEKPCYIFYTTQNKQNLEKSTFEIYLQNRNRSYYLIKVDVYGNENKESRFCEALDLIEKGNFY